MNFDARACDDHLNKTGGQALGGRVKINVGGSVFKASLSTLTRFDDSMFAAMIAGHWQRQDEELFIDRDPTHFRKVLDYLRDGKYVVLPKEDYSLECLQREAEFYNLPGLVEICFSERNANHKAKLDNPFQRPPRVKINVGGTVFETLLSTLTKEKDSMFSAMIAKRGQGQEELFIDRNPELFSVVMEYLRDGKISTVFVDRDAQEKLRRESEFYNLPDLSMCVFKRGDKVQLIESAFEKYCLLEVRVRYGKRIIKKICKICGFPVKGGKLGSQPVPTYIAIEKDGANVTYGVPFRQAFSMNDIESMNGSMVMSINSCCASIFWKDQKYIHLPKTILRLFKIQ